MRQAPGAALTDLSHALADDVGWSGHWTRMSVWTLVAASLVLPCAAAALVPQSPSPSAPASGYGSRLWNAGSGLPINEIWGVEQTPDGYLWLATFAGLVRFDGLRFQVYSSSEYPTLPSDRIEGIHLRPDGSLLLLTELGHLVSFDGNDFTPLVPGPVAGGAVTAVWEDASGQVWVAIDGQDFGRLEGDRFIPAFDGPPGWDVVRSIHRRTGRGARWGVPGRALPRQRALGHPRTDG